MTRQRDHRVGRTGLSGFALAEFAMPVADARIKRSEDDYHRQ
jgi:hypothetical protein